MNNDKYNGLTKSAYYHRLRNWTTVLYDEMGNAYNVSPKHMMKQKEKQQDSNK